MDVACTPESTGWTDQINAVVHYTFSQGGGTYVCSGSMINNTSQDCTPYILSAWHCGEPTAGSNISSFVWYWNYQKTSCQPSSNGSNPSKGNETMTGGTVRASSGNGTLNNPPGANQVAGSDFFLVELSSQPPTSYGAYYAGWDRGTSTPSSGVGIHHPAGSAKKISTYNNSLGANGNFNGAPTNGHWVVQWSATTNGHGVTEGGSSGSPIFDQNKRIVGQLSGGSSFCTNTSATDVYGKMSLNWDQNGTAANAQLAPWLDPTNTGASLMDGSYQPCNSTSPPTCGINASSATITAGGSVNFSDASTGIPTTWAWDFDLTNNGGATPATSTSQNPGSVTFNNVGTYTVELIATNANGSCTTTVNVNVQASLGCDTLRNIADTSTLTIYGSNNGGFITGTNGYGDIAKAEKYTGYSPYTHVNGADVFLFGVQDGGNGTTFDLTIWDDNAGLPNAIVAQASYSLAQLETIVTGNGGNALLYLPFDAPVNVGGNDFYIGVDMSNFGAGDTIGIVSKLITVSVPPNTAYEQWNDLSWHDMQTAWGTAEGFSLDIRPHVTDNPITGSVSASSNTACVGDVINLTASGTGLTDYFWFESGIDTVNNDAIANPTITYTTPGTYTVYCLMGGFCEGNYIDSVQITVTDAPTLTATGNDPSCAGNDGTINASATGGAGSFMYSLNGGTAQSSGTFSGLGAGTYTIDVTDANGCTSQSSVTLNTGGSSVSLNVTSNDPACGASDGDITIVASGGSNPYTYSIDAGTTTQSTGSFSGLGVGSYYIEVVDGAGCIAYDTVLLQSATGPSLTATATNVSCFGSADGSISMNASGGTMPYTYSVDGTSFVSTSTFNGQSASNYTVFVEDASGCQATASVTITEPSQIVVTSSWQDASCGQNNGSITVNATGGVAPLTYSLNGGTPQASNSFTGLASGSYNISVTDASGCSEISSVTISGTTAPTLSGVGNNTTCMYSNGDITLNASGGAAPLTYSIDGGATYVSNSSFNNLAAGTYMCMVQDAAGCTANSTVVLTNSGGFSMNVSPDQNICEGNSATITATGAGTGGTYTWNNSLPSQSTHQVSPIITTQYIVTGTDASGCMDTDTINVNVTAIPNVSVTPASATVCAGDDVTLVASGASTYFWNNGTTNAALTVTPTSQTTYTVIGQNGSCSGTPVQVTVAVDAAPTVVANSDVVSIAVGGTVNFDNAGSSASTYDWDFGDGNSSSQGFVSHTYNVPGVYTVTLTGTIGNCTATDVITINVGTSSINDYDLESAVQVYPNPNTGQFAVKLNIPVDVQGNVRLLNSIGQLVEQNTLNNGGVLNFDLSKEAEGVYFVEITSEIGNVTKRVLYVK